MGSQRQRGMHLGYLIVAVVGGGPIAGCGPYLSANGGELALSERRVFRVAYPDSLVGATVLPGGRTAYWARDGRLTVVDSAGRETEVRLPAGSRVSAVLPEGGVGTLVVDGSRRRLIRISDGGRTLGVEPLAVSVDSTEDVVDAAWNGGRLVVGVTDTVGGGFRVVTNEASGQVVFVGPPSPTGIGPPYRLTQMGKRLLITQTFAPHGISVLRANGEVASFAAPPAVDGDLSALTQAQDWATVATVVLDDEVLQVLSLLSDDVRRLVRYDTKGRVVKMTTLDFPLSIVASDVQRKRLLGVRRAGGLELVLYEWSRRRHGAPPRSR